MYAANYSRRAAQRCPAVKCGRGGDLVAAARGRLRCRCETVVAARAIWWFATTRAVVQIVAQACPSIAEPGCFDQEFPCERCCDTRAIPVGDMSCWLGEVRFPMCCGITKLRLQAAAMLPAKDMLQGPPATCPPAAQPHCFDGLFTCERCCDTRRGAQGDMACWPDSSPWGLRTLSFAFCCGMLPFLGTDRLPW
mmetsp:Transcript_127953/g.368651  ORF Transcript_127953/g.368651 Transcript_127953/m.368651 type:complete len:194 (+) Transcript_127953:129-710(+)